MKDMMISAGAERTQADQSLGCLRMMESAVLKNNADVIALLQLIRRNVSLTPELFDSLRRTELGCRAMASKVSALVELYGGNDAKVPLRPATYDVRQFFTVLTDQINTALGHKTKGEVSFVMDEFETMNATFDARRVCAILYHLVSNALRHGKTENKNVILRPSLNHKFFEISVRDYGGGVPEDRIENLFSGFIEALTLKEIASGPFPPRIRGLGLPLCCKMASEMNGKLEHKNYKTGAKFMLLLPQQGQRIRELSVFYPDDILMQECMADLLKEIMEETV